MVVSAIVLGSLPAEVQLHAARTPACPIIPVVFFPVFVEGAVLLNVNQILADLIRVAAAAQVVSFVLTSSLLLLLPQNVAKDLLENFLLYESFLLNDAKRRRLPLRGSQPEVFLLLARSPHDHLLPRLGLVLPVVLHQTLVRLREGNELPQRDVISLFLFLGQKLSEILLILQL